MSRARSNGADRSSEQSVQWVKHSRAVAVAALVATAAAACSRHLPARSAPASFPQRIVLELAGWFSIPALTTFPTAGGPRFGGISGLASTGRAGEFYAVSDDRVGHRFYRLRIAGEAASFRVQLLDLVRLDADERGPPLDPEAIAVTRSGDLLISSEGRIRQTPRVPPAIARYTARGAFVRLLEVRDRYIPDESGRSRRGVRENAGFESLTLSPNGERLYTATETALVQDGDPVTFDHGTTARLLEYVRRGDTFVPRREFAYPLDAMDAPPFTAGNTATGVVELLALSENDLLALERTYIEVAGQRLGINRVRLYRISLAGSDDVSGVDSLEGAAGGNRFSPVRKTLLLDLSALNGLPPDLLTLDNFEGLAMGPVLADGSRSLILVSDDNFNRAQRTWFLLLRMSGR